MLVAIIGIAACLVLALRGFSQPPGGIQPDTLYGRDLGGYHRRDRFLATALRPMKGAR
jgi:hypothetical protein